MKANELIKKLQLIPQDTQVVFGFYITDDREQIGITAIKDGWLDSRVSENPVFILEAIPMDELKEEDK